jgi:hypothetical protein
MHKWSNGSTKTREDVKVKQRAETPNMTFSRTSRMDLD